MRSHTPKSAALRQHALSVRAFPLTSPYHLPFRHGRLSQAHAFFSVLKPWAAPKEPAAPLAARLTAMDDWAASPDPLTPQGSGFDGLDGGAAGLGVGRARTWTTENEEESVSIR